MATITHEQQLQNALRVILEEVIDACDADQDDLLGELAERLGGMRRIATFDEAGVLTDDKGLVIECDDGVEFRVTVVRSR